MSWRDFLDILKEVKPSFCAKGDALDNGIELLGIDSFDMVVIHASLL